jgi:hypothetical protein
MKIPRINKYLNLQIFDDFLLEIILFFFFFFKKKKIELKIIINNKLT